MRRLYILFFCILLVGLIVKPCFVEEAEAPVYDGYMWESLSRAWKLGWIAGFWSGIDQANLETYVFLMGFAGCMKVVGRTIEKTPEEMAKELHGEFQERIFLGEVRIREMATRLTKFYKDSANKKVLMSEAIYIVKLESKGASQEFIEQVTKLLRMPFKDRVKEQQRLLGSNQEYKKALKKLGKHLPYSVVPTSPEARAIIE